MGVVFTCKDYYAGHWYPQKSSVLLVSLAGDVGDDTVTKGHYYSIVLSYT